jgi:hypothetical protein
MFKNTPKNKKKTIFLCSVAELEMNTSSGQVRYNLVEFSLLEVLDSLMGCDLGDICAKAEQ